ncbi:glycosyltransferase [Luteibacter sp.]|uniref:glycosyltransferase family 2 protein n=1 Tax=Luteibacter sp. TaxID=1886636 RepID=UPI003F7F40A6
MTARIATVIPTYERRQLLKRALESVLEQGVDVSVRVFDNASTDDTEEFVSQWAEVDSRILYHRHATNIGGIANFEFGMSSVDTEFFSILSDDDYLLPGFYERAIAALDNDSEAMFWAGCTLHVDEADTVFEARVESWGRHGRFSGLEGVMAMTGGRAPTWTGIVFRRTVLERLGLPDRAALGPADFDFVLRAAARWPFIIDAHPSAVFTLSSTSFSATQPLSSFWPGWLHLIRNVREWPMFEADVRERIASALEADVRRMLFRRGVAALVAGRRSFANEAARALCSMSDGRIAGWMLSAGVLASGVPGVRAALAFIYRRLEARLLASREDLQRRHGPLLRSNLVAKDRQLP